MIGIFVRWRQLGRRYFWPHLLLGMVAASFGLPVINANAEQPAQAPAETAASSRPTLNINSLALLQDAHRRTAFNVDYWHQHAIRTVIRHLSFALVPQAAVAAEATDLQPSQAQQVALLDTLSALLTQELKPPVIVRRLAVTSPVPEQTFGVAEWLSQVQGIRAGPQRIS